MRILLFLFFSFFLIGANAQVSDSSKPLPNGGARNRVKVNSLNGETIRFYLLNPKIDENAKRFYNGEIDFKGDDVIKGILDSTLTCSESVRPFYFFLFNRIVDLSEGVQSEFIALRCREYIERFPCDFFNSFNQPELNINVVKWTTLIGANLKDKGTYAIYRGGVDSKLKSNCPDVQDLLKSFMMEVRMCLVK